MLWSLRESHGSIPRHLANSTHWYSRLGLQSLLHHHKGCVNHCTFNYDGESERLACTCGSVGAGRHIRHPDALNPFLQ